MDIKDEVVCRICMDSEPILDWNDELYDFCGMSYKDCYYKYTQLDEKISDPYPQLLCGACATSIQSFHLLIEKAIQSERIFQSRWQVSIEIIEDTQNGDFSTDEDEVGPTESVYVMENEESLADLKSETGDNEMWQYEKVEVEPSDCDVKNENPAKKRKTSLEENSCESNSNSFAEDHKTLEGDEEKVSSEEKTEIGKAKTYKTAMCSYCSKICRNSFVLRQHEDTHKEHRDRKEICTVCGFKTFTSTGLNNHMMIHEKNREKKYKCEFCDKAFFNRGACNVHRRIHLGLMVKCAICSKEYCRQIDLDKHMVSHSHAPLHCSNSVMKKKVLVQCKQCDKMVNSAQFNAHRAKHLNDPMMQCTLCKKDFFCRRTCTKHMQKVHKRKTDEYEDICMYYDKYRPRLSRLMREQQELANPEPFIE